MLKFSTLPPSPGNVGLTTNALDELYISHSHLQYKARTFELYLQHLESAKMLGGLAADMLIENGASFHDANVILDELTEQISRGDVSEQFKAGFHQGIITHQNSTRLYPNIPFELQDQ